MSNNSSNNRWLIGVVVILIVVLCGALLVAGAAVFMLTQPSGTATTSSTQSSKPPAATRAPSTGSRNIMRLPARGSGDPPTLDPALAGDADSAIYIVEIFSGLVTLDRNLKVVPDIAERWEISADNKTYTFFLRKEVKFHDGRPVTAQDFKYSFERAANPALASPTADTYLGDIVGVREKLSRRAQTVSGIEVVDDYTLKIIIDSPKSFFLAKLTFPTAFVVDKNNVERGGRTWTDKPNGTGPYKLKEYVRSQRLILARNENFYLDPKPQVEEVQFILGGGSAMTMYENGDLESVYVTINDIERVSDVNSPLNKDLFVGPEFSTNFVVFNTRMPPFDDPKVRQAFALAIDREKIVDVVFRKMEGVATGILPPGMPGYVENQFKIPYDPAKAKQLLAESKYAGKLPDITWTTYGSGGSASQYIQAMTAMIKDNLGINVSIQQTDWATFIGQINDPTKNPYQIFDIAWIADYADPQNFIDILFRSNSTQNWSSYNNPEVDKLLDQAAAERDAQKRFQLYQEIERKILADYPVVPFTFSQQYHLTKPYVKNLIHPPLIIPRLRYVSLEK